MNRRPSGLNLSKAILGFIQYKTAESLSPNTLIAYRHDLDVWLAHLGDVQVNQITSNLLRDHFAWLRTEYKPRRFSGSEHPLSPKSLRNAWTTISAFFTWACAEFAFENPMRHVPAPHFEKPPVEPYSKEEIEAMLKASEYCKEANTTNRRKFVMRRGTARRDRAMILTLLDTGLRASELCSITIGDFDQKTGRIQVKHGVLGGAKGEKDVRSLSENQRVVPYGAISLNEKMAATPMPPLFVGKTNRPFNKTALRTLISSIGKRASIKKCYPHRFRHTFAQVEMFLLCKRC